MNLPVGKNIRLFQNPFLEKFTYVHPIMPVALWGPIAVFLFIKGAAETSLNSALVLLLSGMATWTLAEYLLHRFIFHFHPKTEFGKRIAFLIHGVHHEDPNDARRLLMPPAAAIVLAIIFYTLYLSLLGPNNVKPFFTGFLIGYLCYDYIHFATHHVHSQFFLLKWLKRNHLLHHFKTPDLRYGVSSTFWDHIFRTGEKEAKEHHVQRRIDRGSQSEEKTL